MSFVKGTISIVSVLCLALAFAGNSSFSDAADSPQTGCPPLTITSRPLPVVESGVEYTQKLQVFGGIQPVTFLLVAGLLPPGIKLAPDGTLSGISTAIGDYELSIAVTDSCRPMGQTVSMPVPVAVRPKGSSDTPSFSAIRKTPLKVAVKADPTESAYSIGKPQPVVVKYSITAVPPETATMDSPGASFIVDGSVAETVSAPLTAVLVNGSGELEETVKLSQRVLNFAKREKATKVTYSRAFVGRKTTALGVVQFTLAP